MLSTLEKRILVTVAYTDQFSYPLTLFQIWQRLLVGKSEVVSLLAVNEAVNNLVEQDFLHQQSGFVTLFARNGIMKDRLVAEKRASEREPLVADFLSVVRWLPWVSGVAVTGSLAMRVARPGDDIDFLLITKPGFLWMTRLLLVLVANVYGRRRYWWEDQDWLPDTVQSTRAKWCFNLWLSESSLTVPPQVRSLYSAYEVCQARFVFDRGGVERSFLEHNIWVKAVLPHYYAKKRAASVFRFVRLPVVLAAVLRAMTPLVFVLNSVLYIAQRVYMSARITREIVNDDVAYFHPRDTRSLVYEGWRHSLQLALNKRSLKNENQKKPPAFLSEEQQQKLHIFHQARKKIVLVTGVFDLIHGAHRQFLVQAKMKGDVLVIGVESDLRVRAIKGSGRPLHKQEKRVAQLEHLGLADLVFTLPELFSKPEEHLALLTLIKPSVLAVSSHTAHQAEKAKLMQKVGGRLEVVMDHDASISTTKLMEKLVE